MQDLSPEVLEFAYTRGYFPMPDEKGRNIHWYRPDPRAVIPLELFQPSRTTKKRMRQYHCTIDTAFNDVIKGCGERESTWISADFIAAYSQLHEQSHAHSIEVWQEGDLIGGLYGVRFGSAFFAESMFSRKRDASKVALSFLVKTMREQNFVLLEVQFLTPHLESLGACHISDESYMAILNQALKVESFLKCKSDT